MSTTRIPRDCDKSSGPEPGDCPAPIEPDDEMLYQLATMPPPESIDWKAEYARLYRALQQKRTAHSAEIEQTANQASEAMFLKRVDFITNQLAKETGRSVAFDFGLWSGRKYEFRFYSAAFNRSLGEQPSLVAAEDDFREQWNKKFPDRQIERPF